MRLLSADAIRRCLIADPGMHIFTADYDQIELRVIGALANEPTLINAAKQGISLHLATANRLFGENHTPDEYKKTKNIGFTFAFGGSAWTMTEKYGIPYPEAQKLVADYKETLPNLARFAKTQQDKILKNALSTVEYRTYRSLLSKMWSFRADTEEGKSARKKIQNEMSRICRGKVGYAWNEFGRRLVVDAEKPYTIVNYLVQSSAADIFKQGFLRVMDDPELQPTVLLPVHDELLGQGAKEDAQYLCERYAETMTTEFLGVPITASGKVYGPSWGHGYRKGN
jgi:DNA polymerase I